MLPQIVLEGEKKYPCFPHYVCCSQKNDCFGSAVKSLSMKDESIFQTCFGQWEKNYPGDEVKVLLGLSSLRRQFQEGLVIPWFCSFINVSFSFKQIFYSLCFISPRYFWTLFFQRACRWKFKRTEQEPSSSSSEPLAWDKTNRKVGQLSSTKEDINGLCTKPRTLPWTQSLGKSKRIL